MGIFSSIFGGKDSSAQDASLAQNAEARKFIEAQARQARGDAIKLFPGALAAQNAGVQGALDVLGQTIPESAGVFREGNVLAQGTQSTGLSQAINAILGNDIDLSGLQPQSIDANFGFANQTLPPEILGFGGGGDGTGGGGGGTLADLLGGVGAAPVQRTAGFNFNSGGQLRDTGNSLFNRIAQINNARAATGGQGRPFISQFG